MYVSVKGSPKDMRILPYLTSFNPLTVMHYKLTSATYYHQDIDLYDMLDDSLECCQPRRKLQRLSGLVP